MVSQSIRTVSSPKRRPLRRWRQIVAYTVITLMATVLVARQLGAWFVERPVQYSGNAPIHCGLQVDPTYAASLLRIRDQFVLEMIACQQAAQDSGHVQHIEDGLLTAIVIHGQPSPMKLIERMTYYRVPGMSIAIINNGKIEWAKGYGVLGARGTKAVTAVTAFQAASISRPMTAMAALSLVQAGKLALDENVNLQLKSWGRRVRV